MSDNLTPLNISDQPTAWSRAVIERNWLVFAVTHADPTTGKTGKFPTDNVYSEVVRDRVYFDKPLGTDRAARHTFAEASDLVQHVKPQRDDIAHYAVGYLPRPGSALVVGDLDGCRDPVSGNIADWAVGVLRAGPVYAEVSASKTGIRLLMERMEGDDQHTSGERNGAGFFANGKRGAVLTFNKLPGHDINPVKSPAVRDAILARRGHMARADERRTASVTDPVDYATVRQVLMAIPNDGPPNGATNKRGMTYDEWRDAGYAIKHALGDGGWPLFEWWSALAEKTNPKKTESIWKSLKPDGSITFGKLVHMARAAHGGTLPAHLQAVMGQRRAERHLAHMPAAVGVVAGLGDPWADMPDLDDYGLSVSSLVDASELGHYQPKPREWTVDELIPKYQVTLLTGDGGVGKSLLALQLTTSIATGLPWVGCQAVTGRALYISAEDDMDELHRRMWDIAAGYQVALSNVNALRLWSLVGQDTVIASIAPDNTIQPTPLFQSIVSQIATLRPEVVVFDTLANLYAGNENDRAQVQQFMNLLRSIAVQYQCAVVLLAHPSKSGQVTGDGTSGSTAWHNAVRSRLYLTREQAQDGIEPDPKRRVLDHMKANYGSDDNQLVMRWDKGCFVPVGPDELAATNSKLIEAEAAFLRLLDERNAQGRGVNDVTTTSNYAPKVFAEMGQGISKKIYALAMESLFMKGVIELREVVNSNRNLRKYIYRKDV